MLPPLAGRGSRFKVAIVAHPGNRSLLTSNDKVWLRRQFNELTQDFWRSCCMQIGRRPALCQLLPHRPYRRAALSQRDNLGVIAGLDAGWDKACLKAPYCASRCALALSGIRAALEPALLRFWPLKIPRRSCRPRCSVSGRGPPLNYSVRSCCHKFGFFVSYSQLANTRTQPASHARCVGR